MENEKAKITVKCPIDGCSYRGGQGGVFGHLYLKHRKADIIEALLKRYLPKK